MTGQLAAPAPTARAVVAIDPSLTNTAIAVWYVDGAWTEARLAGVRSAPRSEWSSLEAWVREVLGDRAWVGVVEKPPHVKVGGFCAPSVAVEHWRDFLGQLAQERALERDVRYARPTILAPLPSQWRAPIGLPSKGIGRTQAARRAWLKARSIAFARLHEWPIANDDEAEAAAIGYWAVRCAVRLDRNPLPGARAGDPLRFVP